MALRLTTDEIAALDARAGREGKTRAEVIREALVAGWRTTRALKDGTRGRMLETVVLVFDSGNDLVIHAMKARPYLLDLLP